MKRRTLDIMFAGGGLAIALLMVVLGLVLADQASFARDYVKQQLGDQRITFASAEALTDEEKDWKPGSVCLVDNAGKAMQTGKQAECYANYFIAMHMRRSATNAGYGWDNETYATMGGIQRALRADITEAKDAGDTAAAEELQKELDAATSLRSTFQTGETLRGLLLTTYGFSIFGERADLAATVCLAVAGLLGLLSVAGFVHAFRTPADRVVGVQAPAAGQVRPEPA